ncbi:autotransporter family protein [Bartonella sp. B23]
MKKNFLLCTVSGILFCSYSSLSYASPEKITLLSTVDPSPIRITSNSSQDRHPIPREKMSESLIYGRENSEIVKPPVARAYTEQPTITSQPTENNRFGKPLTSGPPSLIPVIGEIPAVSPHSTPAKPVPNVLQIPPRSSSVKPAPASSIPEIPAIENPSLEALAPVQPVKPIQIEDVQPTIESTNGSTVTKQNIKMHNQVIIADAQNKNSVIKLIGGTASSDFIGLSASNDGVIDATDVTVTAMITGLMARDGTIRLRDSNIIVTSDARAYGILIAGRYNISVNQNAEERDNVDSSKINSNNIVLDNTKIFVKDGMGINIYGISANAKASLKDSEIHADVLLKNTKEENTPANTFLLAADHSLLKGRVRTLEESKTVFELKNGTKWFLNANKNVLNNDNDINSPVYEQFGVDEKSYSNLSTLKLADSVIIFDKPMMGRYQTLFVGSNPQQGDKAPDTPAVYSATGTAEIHLNSKWSSHSPVTEQQTDRLVIDGDVLGSTVVHINLLKKDKEVTDSSSVWEEQMASSPLETHGISIIQVSGKADKNSFKLSQTHLTMDGLPYKYVLTAYAPGTSHASQNLFGKNDRNFWDFRLQNSYIDKDKKIRALLPQVANYLVMPNSLFSSGFSDVNNQNVMLDDMQAAVFGTENNKKKGIFLSSYGKRVTLSSNREPLHYGYGADVNYNALQMGIVLAALESKNIHTHFGIFGTHGKLAFTPKGMEDSEKTTLDKWSLTAYSGIQHSSGVYVNTLLSYGTLKGNITTALSGNVAKLDGTGILNVSATIGKKLATTAKMLTFEPRAQFIYQNLMFDTISDANNFEVDIGKSRQWLIRMGGRLTQTFTTAEEGNALSFYGKLNIIKAFADGGTIKIADTFYLDSTGSSIEGGIGVNAHLSRKIAIHGDISYQKKLQKAGVSGTSFFGGVRYHF